MADGPVLQTKSLSVTDCPTRLETETQTHSYSCAAVEAVHVVDDVL